MRTGTIAFAAAFALAAGGIRAQVTFEIGSAVAAPGETEVAVPFSILMEPGTPPISAWMVAIQYDPAVMADVRIESIRGKDCFLTYGQETFYGPGIVGAAFGYLPPVPSAPGKASTHESLCPDPDPGAYVSESAVVGTIRFCILSGAPPGIHIIGYAMSTAGPDRIGIHSDYEPLNGERPTLLAGFVEVTDDHAVNSGCTPDIHLNEWPEQPESFSATYRLEGGTAARGEELVVPLFMEAEDTISMFSISIDFDEEVLEAISLERTYLGYKEWGFARFDHDNSNRIPGSAGVEEGYVAGCAVFDFQNRDLLLPGIETQVLRLHFRVRTDARTGETLIRFIDGAPFTGVPTGNRVIGPGWDVSPDTLTPPSFVIARINILPDGALFVRGDSNGDFEVDLADAQNTLGYLFLGGSIWCRKAADANDDGRINLTDPVVTLMSLFLGGYPLPSPDRPGIDTTPDGLEDCPRY